MGRRGALGRGGGSSFLLFFLAFLRLCPLCSRARPRRALGRGRAEFPLLLRCRELFQLPQQFLGGGIAVLRIEGAGLQHDFFQFLAAMPGRRQHLAVKAPLPRALLVIRAGQGRRSRHKGRAPVVQQPVQHQPQGIEIRSGAIVLAVIHLRRHVAEGSRPGGGAAGALHGPGHAKVSQLEAALPIHKDVLGLHVPVQHLFPVAGRQGPGHIPAQAQSDSLTLRLAQQLDQGCQQLHFQIDVPAEAVCAGRGADIVAVDDIPAALQPHHGAVFLQDLFLQLVKMLPQASVVIACQAQFPDLLLVLGDGHALYGRALLLAAKAPSDLIDRAVAAPADEAHRLPAWPKLLQQIVRHGFSSCQIFRAGIGSGFSLSSTSPFPR